MNSLRRTIEDDTTCGGDVALAALLERREKQHAILVELFGTQNAQILHTDRKYLRFISS